MTGNGSAICRWCKPFGPRLVIPGNAFTLEVKEDGTGVIRDNLNGGFPVAITSEQTSKILKTIRLLVDDLSRPAAEQPASWPR